MTKMRKPKIKSILSKEQNKERADLFVIEISEDLHKSLISLLNNIGFNYNEIQDFDTVYQNEDLFIFVSKKDLRVYLTNGQKEDEVLLIITSHIKKQELMKKLEENFQIF